MFVKCKQMTEIKWAAVGILFGWSLDFKHQVTEAGRSSKNSMKMSKQLTLFGTCAKSTKSYIIYRDPKGDYECFIGRYCLRAKRERGHIANQKIVAEAQSKWKNIYKGNNAKLDGFFVLQENEKEFARYSSIIYYKTGHVHLSSIIFIQWQINLNIVVALFIKLFCNFIISEKKIINFIM